MGDSEPVYDKGSVFVFKVSLCWEISKCSSTTEHIYSWLDINIDIKPYTFIVYINIIVTLQLCLQAYAFRSLALDHV